MDLKRIHEIKGLASCLHPTNLSLFLLTKKNDKFIISEMDLYTGAIFKQYNPPFLQPNTSYHSKTINRYEKFTLYFLELQNKLAFLYPYAYIAFFDYESAALVNVFHLHGKYEYYVSSSCISELSSNNFLFFFTTVNGHSVYAIETKGTAVHYHVTKKLPLTPGLIVLQLCYYSNAGSVYAACSDGRIHVWDYLNGKQLAGFGHAEKNVTGASLSLDMCTQKLLYGNSLGAISIWDISRIASKDYFENKHFGVEAICWLPTLRSSKDLFFASTFSNGFLSIFKYNVDNKPKAEEVISLEVVKDRVSFSIEMDHNDLIMMHKRFPFIVSAWPKAKGKRSSKYAIAVIEQATSPTTELAVTNNLIYRKYVDLVICL